MEILALGKTEAIGANCYFLFVDGTGIVLDAGADPEEDGSEGLPQFELIHQKTGWYVDHALVTHAHHDHIGALPVLIQHFPHVQIHMTKATRELAEFVLPASARLQKRRLREGSSIHQPLFDEKELEVYSFLYLTHELGLDFDVTGLRGTSPVTARFYCAGHILGSAGVLLTVKEGERSRRIFYTSDTNMRSQSIIPGGEYPEDPIDILIMESTLGGDAEAELTTRRTEEKKFADTLNRVIERKGTVLIPVFALGRAQEILALIDRFKQKGRIPSEVPIYTSGSLRAVADVYDKTRLNTRRLDPEFQIFGVEQRRLPRSDGAIQNALSGPSIHVVGSGMMFERTTSNQLAQELVEDDKNAILLVGFVREYSPARRILDAALQGFGTDAVIDEVRGPQPIRCEVERFRFSGHSHRRDLIQLVELLSPKKVVLVHGEEKAQTWMADNIAYFYPDIEIQMLKVGVPLKT